jgi:hypothetical protein
VRTRQSKNTNTALAAYDVLDDPPVQSAMREGPRTCPPARGTIVARAVDRQPRPDQAVGGNIGGGARASVPGTLQLTTLVADQAHVVEVRPLREAGDSSHPRTSRPPPGVEDGQLHPVQAAEVCLPPHGWRTPPPHSWRMPLSPERRRKKRVAGPRGGRPQLAPPSSPARMMKILEAEGGAEAATRLASPHHKANDHPYG